MASAAEILRDDGVRRFARLDEGRLAHLDAQVVGLRLGGIERHAHEVGTVDLIGGAWRGPSTPPPDRKRNRRNPRTRSRTRPTTPATHGHGLEGSGSRSSAYTGGGGPGGTVPRLGPRSLGGIGVGRVRDAARIRTRRGRGDGARGQPGGGTGGCGTGGGIGIGRRPSGGPGRSGRSGRSGRRIGARHAGRGERDIRAIGEECLQGVGHHGGAGEAPLGFQRHRALDDGIERGRDGRPDIDRARWRAGQARDGHGRRAVAR